MGCDRRNLAVEILVENFDHGFGGKPVRQRGKAAQIRQPDRGLHGLGMAAPDLSAKNAFAGAVADIGIEQDRRHEAQPRDLDQSGKRRDQPTQGLELHIGEAARLFRGPAGCVHRAVDIEQRQRDIIGDALRAQIIKKRKVLGVRTVDQRPDLASFAKDDRERTRAKLLRIQHLVVGTTDHNFAAQPPYEIAADDIGVQGADKDADARQRQTGCDQPFAGLGHHRRWAGRRPRAIDQPFDQFVQSNLVHGAPLAGPAATTSRRTAGIGSSARIFRPQRQPTKARQNKGRLQD